MPTSQHPIHSRHSVPVRVGTVVIGGDAPVVVQSMTNTDTADVAATVHQVRELAQAGSELVRITVNSEAAAAAVPAIAEQLAQDDTAVPLIGDFHFNGHKLLAKYPDCALALAKYRINPGNVGRGKKRDEQFAQMVETACRHDKPVRIGVNWGSLDQALVARLMDANSKRDEPLDAQDIMHEIMVTSALESAAQAEALGLPRDHITLSAKLSGVQDLIAVYRMLSAQSDYALHLGLTEAGMGSKGIVASTAALAVLLQEGIGDTIRISLTPEPGGDRTHEVIVAQELLQSMGLRHFTPAVIACPGCGRTTSTYFQQLAQDIQSHLRSADAPMARALPRRGGNEGGRHGLRGQRSRREQACRHRHQPAGHRRGAGCAGVCRRREDRHAEGRLYRRGFPAHRRRVRAATLRRAVAVMPAH